MKYCTTHWSLEIDLTTGNVEKKAIEDQEIEPFPGGIGFNAKLIYDRVSPDTHSFAEENVLIFTAGFLTGTLAIGANRTIISSISPQNNYMAFSMMGGFFSPELKYAGYDRIVIRGKASHLVYVWIKNDKVEIYVLSDELKPYWGTLKLLFKTYSLSFNIWIVLLLWLTLLLFLHYKNYTYLALLIYLLFNITIYAESLNFGILDFKILMSYTFYYFSMVFLFLWIYQVFSNLKSFRVSFFIVSLFSLLTVSIPLIFMLYTLNFDHELSKESLYAIFQSNTNESYEYIKKFISLKYIILFIISISILLLLSYKQERRETLVLENSILWFLIMIFFTITLSRIDDFRLNNFVVKNVSKYIEELQRFREVQAKRKIGEIKFSATKEGKGEAYIVVIGESLNKNHMGIYGYMRKTTPHLSKIKKKGELILFNHAYSNHTHTVPVLSLGLTEANQYNHKSYYDSLSIIDILNRADVETYWLTNQTIYGGWDNMISVIATTSKHIIALNSSIGCNVVTQHYDESLVEKLKTILAIKTEKNRVIFIHLMGSHSIYSSRYPNDRFSLYKENLEKNIFGKSTIVNQELNYYDNSIVYNDYVVSSILKEFQKKRGVKAFIYMSDHADDINRDLGHSVDFFTYEMTEIPFMGWFSSEYQKKYNNQYHNFLAHREKLFSNDMFYDTLIGMFNIKTKKYNSLYDLTSSRYKLEPKDALVLHGERSYIDKQNHKYWQKRNIKDLNVSSSNLKISPSNVNTLGKLNDILNNGFKSFEIEVDMENKLYLESLFKKIDFNKVEIVYLRFKHLTEDNYALILEYLNSINQKFNLKNRLVLELTLPQVIQSFKDKGWHCSYYISEMNLEKELINIQKSKVAFLSFNSELYPFVKKLLEPSISNESLYLIHDSLELYDIDFKSKMRKKTLYTDSRVKAIWLKYQSDYDKY